MYYRYAHPELFEGVPRPDFAGLSGRLAIYGAGLTGLLTAWLLEQQGIEALCFLDRDPKKQGRPFHGLPVLSPEEGKRRFPRAVPVVAVNSVFPVWRSLTRELGYPTVLTPFSLLLEFDPNGFETLRELPAWFHMDSIDYHVDMFLLRCVNLLTPHRLLSVDVSVTERCNLRCRHCNALMPCYEAPRDSDPGELIHAFDTLLQGRVFDHINIEGGEPFLWDPLPELLSYLNGRGEVMRIFVLTNGTILPAPDLSEALRLPKVAVRVSDYGDGAGLDVLRGWLQERQIAYRVYQQRWYELQAYHRAPLQGQTFRNVIDGCSRLEGSSARYLTDGRLFNCPEQANLHKLGVFRSEEDEYVDLRGENTAALQSRISAFLDPERRSGIPRLCRHCGGRGFQGTEVPPAEQLAPGETIMIKFE